MDKFLVQGISMTVLGYLIRYDPFLNGTTNQIVMKNSAKKNSTSYYLYEKLYHIGLNWQIGQLEIISNLPKVLEGE